MHRTAASAAPLRSSPQIGGVALTLLSLLACGYTPTEPVIPNVSGTVRSATTQQPIAGAAVRFSYCPFICLTHDGIRVVMATTDSAGRYGPVSFNSCPTALTVSVRATDFAEYVGDGSVLCVRAPQVLQFQLTPLVN